MMGRKILEKAAEDSDAVALWENDFGLFFLILA